MFAGAWDALKRDTIFGELLIIVVMMMIIFIVVALSYDYCVILISESKVLRSYWGALGELLGELVGRGKVVFLQ